MVGVCVETSKLSSDNQLTDDRAGDGKPRDQKWPRTGVAKPGLRRFQAIALMKSRMNCLLMTALNSDNGGHAKRESISIDLLQVPEKANQGTAVPRMWYLLSHLP